MQRDAAIAIARINQRATSRPHDQVCAIAHMSEKLDQFEVQREITLMLDSFEAKVSREILAGLAERYGFNLMDKAAGSGNSARPTYRKKRSY